MEIPTVYVSEPEDASEAWRQLARLLEQVHALFFLVAAATDPCQGGHTYEPDDVSAFYYGAMLGLKLVEEAKDRAETLRDLGGSSRRDTPTAVEQPVQQGEED